MRIRMGARGWVPFEILPPDIKAFREIRPIVPLGCKGEDEGSTMPPPPSSLAFLYTTMSKTHASVVGPATAGVVVSVKSSNRCFGGEKVIVSLEAEKLPWDRPEFIRGLMTLGLRYGIAHRQTKSVAEWLELVITTGTMDSKLVKLATEFMKVMEEGDLSWEAVEKGIATKYPWKLASRDLDGLITHFAQKAEWESAQTDPLANL